MIQPSFFKNLYLKSLTPFELLDFSKKSNCSFEKRDQLRYLDIWKKSINKNGSKKVFKEYCNANRLTSSDVSLMTSEINNCNEEINLPFWLKTLKTILNEITIDKIKYSYTNQDKPFYDLLLPFIDFFSSKLTKNLKDLDIMPLSSSVINQLNLALYKNLFDISNLVLLDEFSKFKNKVNKLNLNDPEDFYFKKFVSSILSNKFKELFFDYPMLARKMATITHRYINFITSMIERFQADKDEIECFFDTKIDKISQLILDLGDQHNGECAVIFEFENSYKIVYKPTNIAITFAYNHFLDWINNNLDEKLKSFNVLDKQIYGWLEYVEHLECDNINDIRLYYERCGILLGIAYFLNSKDYHFENVIASGNCPVLIDHETIIGPTIKMFNEKTKKDNSIEIIIGTVLETLLIPSGDKHAPPYICGFGSSIQLESNSVVPRIKNCNNDSMIRVPKMVIRSLYKSNKPRLNNKIENLIDYQPEFKKGFHKIYSLILDNKTFLLSEKSPLTHFKNLKIRFINRQTGVYFKILKFLNKPEFLKDSTLYGLKLELLARAYAVIGNWSPILSSERDQMLIGDIPVFYTKTLSKNLVLPNGQIADVYQLNAIETIISKIKNANLDDYQKQMNLIQDRITL